MSNHFPEFYESIVEACKRGELWGIEKPSTDSTQLEIDLILIMPSQLIVICSAGLLALSGIWVLISGFDDDDNDGDGMTYPELQRLGT